MSLRKTAPILLSLLLAAPCLAQTQPVTPTQREQARQHYVAGTRKFDVAKYDEAAEEFEKAYELVGDPSILFNIAQSYRLARQYEKALTFYRSYLRRAQDDSNRAEVEKRIAEMSDLVAKQKQISEAPPTGTLPTGPAEKGGAPSLPPPAIPPPPPAAPAPPPKAFRSAGFALGGLAVASLAVGGAMSGLAARASSDVESGAQKMATWSSAFASRESKGHTYDTVSYVGYAVGGASAVTAGVLLLLYYRHPAEKRLALVPSLGRDMAGLAATGRF